MQWQIEAMTRCV